MKKKYPKQNVQQQQGFKGRRNGQNTENDHVPKEETDRMVLGRGVRFTVSMWEIGWS